MSIVFEINSVANTAVLDSILSVCSSIVEVIYKLCLHHRVVCLICLSVWSVCFVLFQFSIIYNFVYRYPCATWQNTCYFYYFAFVSFFYFILETKTLN